MPSELREDVELLALRLELPEDPDDAFMPRSLEPEELDEPDDEPLFEALKPPCPERSCELLNPEFVLPEAPRPELASLRSPTLVELLLDDDPPWLPLLLEPAAL
jgi:hypothetical protein